MCDPITMITGGTALLSTAMGIAQQAIGVTQQLQMPWAATLERGLSRQWTVLPRRGKVER